jgi:hypothetical protein
MEEQPGNRKAAGGNYDKERQAIAGEKTYILSLSSWKDMHKNVKDEEKLSTHKDGNQVTRRHGDEIIFRPLDRVREGRGSHQR